jgi:hypothetical protein
LGQHDQLVAWLKLKTYPSRLARETLAALPEALVLREVRYRISTPGFRTREITLVTTLLEAEIYRVADLAELYRLRWQIRDLSRSAQGNRLHSNTPPWSGSASWMPYGGSARQALACH